MTLEEKRETHRIANKNWRIKNKDKMKEFHRKWYHNHQKEENERAKKWRKENKEYCRKNNREWIAKNPEKYLLSNAKKRAKLKKVPFNIEFTDIIIPSICPILGIPIYRGSGRSTFNSPTLDRIIPELGYVKGNIAVISFRANSIKNDATAEELRKVADWLDLQNNKLQ